MADLLQQLAQSRRPIDLPAQPVHGDLLGNVLFADDQPPAVIDWPVYYRPGLWAQAIAVVDAITWCGGPEDLAWQHRDRPGWNQLLIRALIYRVATNEGCRRHAFRCGNGPRTTNGPSTWCCDTRPDPRGRT